MDMLWPRFLYLLGAIPLIIAIYIWMLRRRKRFTVRYSSLTLVREAVGTQSRLRRHIPFALFVLALASLIVALARPVTVVSMPSDQTSIILTMDVSRSMCSTDIPPSRMEAAQAAALDFIRRQKASTQIGVVAFSGFAELIQVPTTDPELLESAIDGLMTGRRTAIGSSILKSLDAIAEFDKSIAPSDSETDSDEQLTPVPEGYFAPAIIVLLTDGASNTGPLPVDAAQQAADRGVRVYTIGFGTENGGDMDCGDQFQGFGPYGGGGQGFGGNPQFFGGFRRGIDEETLREVAALTEGTYYSAMSAGELQDVFRNLPVHLLTRRENMEISVAFAAIGALLAATAILLSLVWHPLP